MKKITSLFLVLLMAIGVKAQDASEPIVKMTWVNADQSTTAMGEVEAGSTAMAGYNKISNGSVAMANSAWGVNNITYIQVDASALDGIVTEATLSVDVSGSTDNKRTTGWGVGYNTSVWSEEMTYESADRAITTLDEVKWTSTNSSTTFETLEFDILAAFTDDEDKVVTLVVYETAAAGGYIKNPTVSITVSDKAIAVTGISLDKTTAEITEGMVLNLLTATVAPENATDKTVTWTSSNEAIATVDGGQVTGVAVGTATITATASGFSASCEVTVKAKANLTSWDFAALQASLPNKTGMTCAVNTVKVGGIDCNYGINEYEGLAIQGAGSWFLYTDGGLYNGNSGGRNIGVLNLKKGQIITVVTNTDTGLTLADAATATQLSVETADGLSTYTYGMKADGTLALTLVRNKVVVSINIEDYSILVVTDGEGLDAEGTYDKATYTRTVNPAYNYGTICLPFAPDAATCENYTFYALESTSENAFTFTEVETPQANMPYLYSAINKEATTHTFTGGETTVSEEPNYGGADQWMFIGTFVEADYSLPDMGMVGYAYSPTNEQDSSRPEGDVLVKITNHVIIKPYRACFLSNAASAGNLSTPVTMRIVVRGAGDNGDGTTAIEEVITPDQIEGAVAPAIYDLMGRPVQNPVKGQIYIVNGKKVVY